MQNDARVKEEEKQRMRERRAAQPYLKALLSRYSAVVMIRAGTGIDQQSRMIRANPGYKVFTGRDPPEGMSLQGLDWVLSQIPKEQLLPGAGVGDWLWERFVGEMRKPSTSRTAKFKEACMLAIFVVTQSRLCHVCQS